MLIKKERVRARSRARNDVTHQSQSMHGMKHQRAMASGRWVQFFLPRLFLGQEVLQNKDHAFIHMLTLYTTLHSNLGF